VKTLVFTAFLYNFVKKLKTHFKRLKIMDQILDETDKALTPQKTFSKWAFGTAIVTATLIIFYISQIPSEIKVSELNKPSISTMLGPIMSISCFLGFVFTIISFVKKEPSSVIKWIAAVINIAPLLIIIWANIVDFLR
jgi:hypothetical protein